MTDSRIRSGDSLSEGLAEGLLAVLKDDQSLRVRVAVLQLADQLTGLTGWTNFGGGGLQDSREGGGGHRQILVLLLFRRSVRLDCLCRTPHFNGIS